MRSYKKTNLFLVLGIIATIGFGCNSFQLKDYVEIPEEPKKTVITKELLKERLTARFVKIVEGSNNNPETSSSPIDSKKLDLSKEETSNLRPNPLTLHLKFSTASNNFLLNSEYRASFGELANTLKAVFKGREEDGVFIEGTNEVYKKITLPAYQKLIDEYNSKNIFVEDFEKLVDDLRNQGFDQLELDVNEENYRVLPPDALINGDAGARLRQATESKNEPKNPADIKAVSGGVLNGKAISLPKPAYPPAAQAVRASGAVNVQVTVDENGEVIEASAVSGHPLLRQNAVMAARDAKFNPTLLNGKAVKVKGIVVYNFAP